MVLCFVSYANINLTCKLELNTAIVDFDRFEVIFHNSYQRPQMERFLLVTQKAANPANLSSIRRF